MRDARNFVEGFAIPSDKRIGRAKDRKVDFVIAGAAKGGNTALDAYLRLNLEICMPYKTKEIHFFNSDKLFSSGDPDYRMYHAFFKPKPVHRVLGEASPGYMNHEDIARRVHAYNPEMKFILTLRNPIDRAFSHWNMHIALGRETLSFDQAIRNEEERSRAGRRDGGGIKYAYADRGYYVEQIRRLRRYFPPRQILIFKQEELRDNHNSTLDSIWGFLDLKPLGPVEPIEKLVGHYTESMTGRDRDHLRGIFGHEIKALEQMLGWDCSNWLA